MRRFGVFFCAKWYDTSTSLELRMDLILVVFRSIQYLVLLILPSCSNTNKRASREFLCSSPDKPKREESVSEVGLVKFDENRSTCSFCFVLFFIHHFCFPAQLEGGFTLSKLLDKPWSQVSSLLAPRYVPSIFIAHRVQHSHCSSILHRTLLTHALALSADHFFLPRKKSVRICALGEN